MTIPWALAVPVINFLAIIVPLRITFHYITVWARLRADKKVAATGDDNFEQLHALAERLEVCMDSIETILDHESPGWRHKREPVDTINAVHVKKAFGVLSTR